MAEPRPVLERMRAALPSLSPTVIRPVQLALSQIILLFGIVVTADMLDVGGDARENLYQARATVAESLAMQLSMVASIGDDTAVDHAVASFVARNANVQAASLVRTGGAVLARHGELDSLYDTGALSSLTHMNLPILDGQTRWGEVRVVFTADDTLTRRIEWFAFVGLFSFVSLALFLGKALTQLDPARVVPSRVENAFDLFSAGVVILDERLRIVVANRSAAEMVGRPIRELTGSTLESWPWMANEKRLPPWTATLQGGHAFSDVPMRMRRADGEERLFSVSCSVVGAEGEARGVLLTLDDLTPIERRNHDLSEALREVQIAKESISAKNRELEILATTDPLTGISNRRSLMERLALDVERARQEDVPLSCIMSDIDHFKRVNDTYGHAVGDDVIRSVAETLKTVCREDDTIGRYGGEEFVMVLPGLDANGAAMMAERVRVGVMALARGDRLVVPELSSSFGVAELHDGVVDGGALVDAADQALYVAKQGGRNRVEISGRETGSPEVPEVEPVVQASSEDLMAAKVIDLETRLTDRERAFESHCKFDPLTGMPLRALFLERVEEELARAERVGTAVTVMSCELRGLERILASFGHAPSDTLVVEFAERVQTGLRSTRVVPEPASGHGLFRIMSNEYGLLLDGTADTADAMLVVTRLKDLLSQPFIVGEEKVHVGANIGIALSGAEDDLPAILFGRAGKARLEAAAKPDKVAYEFASVALDDESHEYIRLESDLYDALERRELEIWFQPKFDLVRQQVTGLEALLRWRHSTRGFVAPASFIAVAEANGLIDELSRFVLERTLEQIRLWQTMGFDELRVSINISPVQLRDETLVSDTLAALERAGVPSTQLEIELTETSVLDRPVQAGIALQQLREAGVAISLDDFGTGSTSLALLADLPLDTLKIDRSFIVAMSASERSRAVVESIITMAHALKLRVVGEGVETDEELDILSGFGCDEVQGYLISRPQPAADITAFLVRQRDTHRARRRA